MLYVTAPEALNGEALTAELDAAGIVTSGPVLAGDELRFVDLDEDDRDAVEPVVAAHVPPDPAPDPDVEFRAAVEKASSIADLKAALLGTAGPGAQARRPT